MRSESKRHATIISIILKITVVVFASIGVIMSSSGGRGFMGGGRAFMYFTIQSNIAIAIISAIDIFFVILNRKDKKSWFIIRFMGAISITLTGVVFCLFLAPTLGGYIWSTKNVFTHVVVPLAAIADFLLTETYSNSFTCSSLWGTLPPFAYAVYAGIGFVCKWEFAAGTHYPYTFLNWESPAGAIGFSKEPPFIGCVWWILILLLFILYVGRVYTKALISLRQHKTGKGCRE